MKTVIIVSKCLRVTKLGPEEHLNEFHFKGVCSGVVLQKVTLRGTPEMMITKGEEYLLYVQMHSIEDHCLKGSILKVKLLGDCWDKS